MAADLRAYIQVASNANVFFTNTSENDVVVYPTSNSQKILLGNTSNTQAALTITSNSVFFASNVGVGMSNPAYGIDVATTTRTQQMLVGTGGPGFTGLNGPITKGLVLSGTNGSTAGPHVHAYTASAYPSFQIVNWTHDNTALSFDMYADGTTWRNSTSTNPGYQIYKLGNRLNFSVAPTVASAGGTSPPVTVMALSNSNVGIGTISPEFTLVVSADTQLGTHNNNNFAGDPNQGQLVVCGRTDQNKRLTLMYDVQSNIALIQSMRFGVGGTPLCLQVAGGGAVGIGTKTPSERLHVAGNIYSETQFLNNSNDSAAVPAYSFKEDSNTGIFHASNDAIGFSTGGTERIRIDISNMTVSTHIVPSSNEIYDIGTSNMRFRDLYLSGNTIFMGSNYTISTDSNTDTLALMDRRTNQPIKVQAREVILTGSNNGQRVLRVDDVAGPLSTLVPLPRTQFTALAMTSAVDNNWQSVCWSPQLGIFVASAASGTGNRVMTSPDGITWTARTTPADNNWKGVCWSPQLGLFVAVADTGAGNRVMTSPNGITWTARTSPADNNWVSVCWSPERTLFVAVAWSGTGNRVMTSPDGITWTTRTSAGDITWASVCWSPERALFVAVAASGAGNRVMTSPDGITWTLRTSAADNNWLSVCWSQERGLFVAVSSTGTGNRVMTSPDGITWTARVSAADNDWTSVCWARERGIFVAVANTGSGNRIMTSPDGITWTARTSPADNRWMSTCWSPELGIFVAVADNNTGNRAMIMRFEPEAQLVPMTMRGGMTNSTFLATARTSAADNNWIFICWSPERAIFVALSDTGTGNRVMTSPDGITWTARASAADNTWSSVCWSPERGLFVAVGQSGTGNRVMTSPDGITWTARTSATDNPWYSVCWSPERGIFVAVAWSGSNSVMTSPDGITWTARTSAADNQWHSVCWSPERGLFVAVSQSGAGNRVMTSPDGITWTARTTVVNNGWRSVCWSSERGLFVAVANTGTGNRVMTSPDGITWTARASAVNNEWMSVCWSSQLGVFVAVAYTGTGNRIMTSPDGIIWTIRTSPADNLWFSVCWSPQLGIFAAVAASGTGNRVMTMEANQAGYLDMLMVGESNVSNAPKNRPVAVFNGSVQARDLVLSSGSNNAQRVLRMDDVAGPPSTLVPLPRTQFTALAMTSAADNNWISVCWSPERGIFVAVAESGTGNRVMTSPNGITWTARTSAADHNWRSVCWSPERGLFVVVSSTGTGNRVMTSPDGITWTARTSAADNNWNSVCWSPERGLFVAVAWSGSGNRVMTSPDGITWTSRTSAADNQWISVCWSPVRGLFVAVSNNGTGNRVMTSPDGITWTARTSAADNNWSSVCWSQQLGIFAAVAWSGTGNRVMTSPDGITWTSRTSAADNNWSSVCWSPERGIFVAVADTGTGNRVMTSPDGITWTARASAADNNWHGVCWSPQLGIFAAVAFTGTGNRAMLMRFEPEASLSTVTVRGGMTNSTFLATARTSAADNNWFSVCWSPERSLFVAVGITGTGNRVMTSPDGITWTARTSAADNDWLSVCWSTERGLFVAVSITGTGNRVMTSPDGITWTARTSAADNSWRSVCWSAERGLFVAVADSGTGNRVMTSPDGITWTARTSAVDNGWHSVCWSPERGLFVAVAWSGIGNRVMTSSDGITWTARAHAANNVWLSVCWSPERGLFVAVADSGIGNRVMTSPDGITWTTRASAADNNWYSLCWSSERGIFIAVAYSGTGNRIMTSPDGIVWTIRTSPADNQWLSVCWSPQLGIFAAVANTGTGNRVMTMEANQAAFVDHMRVGGSNAPVERLHVTGKILSSTQFLNDGGFNSNMPCYSFLSDSNTGMYNAAADAVGFVTGGVERVRITPAGNVGIGTTTPSSTLHVVGGIQVDGGGSAAALHVRNNVSSVEYGVAASTNQYSGSAIAGDGIIRCTTGRLHLQNGILAAAMTIGTNNNVGIGTSTPSAPLDVIGNAITTSLFVGNSNYQTTTLGNTAAKSNFVICDGIYDSSTTTGSCTPANKIRIHNQATWIAGFGISLGALNYHSGENHVFWTQSSNLHYGSERMRISSAGYVGIGTATPVNRLTLASSYGDSNTGFCINASDINNTYQLRMYAFVQGGAQVGYKFDVQNVSTTTTALTLGHNGNVGIGTTTPSELLNVAGNILSTGTITSGATFGQGYIGLAGTTHMHSLIRSNNDLHVSSWGNMRFFPNSTTAPSSGTERMCILTSGNVGIGTAAPTYPLHVVGSEILLDGGGWVAGLLIRNNVSTVTCGVAASTGQYSTSAIAGDGIIRCSTGRLHLQYGIGAAAMTIGTTNLIGINTASPGERLHVAGKIYSTDQFLNNSNDSAAVPSYSFLEDSNTGMFHASNDAIGFSTAGTERVRITDSGNVGIGVSTPTYPLHVSGSVSLTHRTYFRGVYDYGGIVPSHRRYALLATLGFNQGTARVILTGGGADTATTTQQAKAFVDLYVDARIGYVKGTVHNEIFPGSTMGAGIAIYNNSNTNDLSVYMTGGGFFAYCVEVQNVIQATVASNVSWSADTAFTPPAGNALMYDTLVNAPANSIFSTVYATRSTISSNFTHLNNGNVGVGLSNPSHALHVAGKILSSTQFLNDGGFNSNVPCYSFLSDSNTGMYNAAADAVGFVTGGVERIRVNSSGNVGIGTITPNAPLQFANSTANRKIVLWEGANNDHDFYGFGLNGGTLRFQIPGTGTVYAWNTGTSATTSAELMRLTGTGYLGIGTASPSYPLHVNTQVGNVSIQAGWDIVAFSDARVKTDLAPITDALAKINNITGYTYKRVDNDTDRRVAGVVAQEVKAVLPEVIHEDENGMMSVAYGNMSALLIEAIKELKRENAALKHDYIALKHELESIKSFVGMS